jgi:flagellar biosynthesis protein FlhG
MAVGFGVALSRAGLRVAVIETDLEHGCMATTAGLRAAPSLSDVLAGRITLVEAIVDGPEDIGLVAGARGGTNHLDAYTQHHLLEQIEAVEDRFDVFLIVPAADLSTGTLFVVGAAHTTAVILPPDRVADAATLKMLGRLSSRADEALGVVLHGAADADRARADFAALVSATRFGAQACLTYLGWVPIDRDATACWTPAGPAGRRVAELVDPWRLAPPAKVHGGLQFFFEPLLAAREAA